MTSGHNATIKGGVDYQMIQTKRGRDMLLYGGFTYTQNRMCKDGMRWQCSYPRCRAYCRMSSAGWLTPFRTAHQHPKPSEEEIRKKILRMKLKARARSSGATPGEIIRNALPAEYQTTDKRACYTRCIQRFRKSLQKKNSKPVEDAWQESKSSEGNEAQARGAQCQEVQSWKPVQDSERLDSTDWAQAGTTQPESTHVDVTGSGKHSHVIDPNNLVLDKMEPYGL